MCNATQRNTANRGTYTSHVNAPKAPREGSTTPRGFPGEKAGCRPLLPRQAVRAPSPLKTQEHLQDRARAGCQMAGGRGGENLPREHHFLTKGQAQDPGAGRHTPTALGPAPTPQAAWALPGLPPPRLRRALTQMRAGRAARHPHAGPSTEHTVPRRAAPATGGGLSPRRQQCYSDVTSDSM